jgi:hypothetical protein
MSGTEVSEETMIRIEMDDGDMMDTLVAGKKRKRHHITPSFDHDVQIRLHDTKRNKKDHTPSSHIIPRKPSGKPQAPKAPAPKLVDSNPKTKKVERKDLEAKKERSIEKVLKQKKVPAKSKSERKMSLTAAEKAKLFKDTPASKAKAQKSKKNEDLLDMSKFVSLKKVEDVENMAPDYKKVDTWKPAQKIKIFDSSRTIATLPRPRGQEVGL